MFFRGGTCVNETRVKGSGAKDGGPGGWWGDVAGVSRRGKLSMMCWNVGGWSKKDGG